MVPIQVPDRKNEIGNDKRLRIEEKDIFKLSLRLQLPELRV